LPTWGRALRSIRPSTGWSLSEIAADRARLLRYTYQPARRDRRVSPQGQGSRGGRWPHRCQHLGLTDAVAARIGLLTDGHLRPITLGTLTLDFQAAAPRRLHWAGRPAMRLVQAPCSFLKTPIMDRRFQDDLRRDGVGASDDHALQLFKGIQKQDFLKQTPRGTSTARFRF
jgi:hypothetical protein